MGREGRDYWEAQLSEYWDSGLTILPFISLLYTEILHSGKTVRQLITYGIALVSQMFVSGMISLSFGFPDSSLKMSVFGRRHSRFLSKDFGEMKLIVEVQLRGNFRKIELSACEHLSCNKKSAMKIIFVRGAPHVFPEDSCHILLREMKTSGQVLDIQPCKNGAFNCI